MDLGSKDAPTGARDVVSTHSNEKETFVVEEGIEVDQTVSCENEEEEDIARSVNDENEEEEETEQYVTVEDIEVEELETLTKLKANDVHRMTFNSLKDGEAFYKRFSKVVGFGIRKGNARLNKNKEIVSRKWLCSSAGFRMKKNIDRKTEPRPVTRFGCQAYMLICLKKKDMRWHVSRFKNEHNHPLVPYHVVHHVRSHRGLTKADATLVKSMKSGGLRPCQIMNVVTNAAGGYTNVGYTRQDVYNYVDRCRKEDINNGDATAALSYLSCKSYNDNGFFMKFKVGDGSRLEKLFWADSISMLDFECFGDVLSFDTTYKKNAYNMPLVIFSGVNHHNNTCVFACALLNKENEESYNWVLETFVEAMSRKPKAVVTDGDKAMANAISKVFPDATHRLCSWHLFSNAKDHVKDKRFLPPFRKCMFADCGIEAFEEKWRSIVTKFSLESNNWIANTYEKRREWATAYLRDKFFASVRTTSRCEGINSFIKKYVSCQHNLLEFVHDFDRALRHLRENEVKADFKSNYGTPEIRGTGLKSLEISAAGVYSREAFFMFRDQLEASGGCIINSSFQISSKHFYEMTMYEDPRVVLEVTYQPTTSEMECSCYKFRSTGILCAHMICALREQRVKELPSDLVLRRWTKDPKGTLENHERNDAPSEEEQKIWRHGILQYHNLQLASIGAESSSIFKVARSEIAALCVKLKAMSTVCEGATLDPPGDDHGDVFERYKDVKDPEKSRHKGCRLTKNKKGKVVKSRQCGNCGIFGHYASTCKNSPKYPAKHSSERVRNDRVAEEQEEEEDEEQEDDEEENEAEDEAEDADEDEAEDADEDDDDEEVEDEEDEDDN